MTRPFAKAQSNGQLKYMDLIYIYHKVPYDVSCMIIVSITQEEEEKIKQAIQEVETTRNVGRNCHSKDKLEKSSLASSRAPVGGYLLYVCNTSHTFHWFFLTLFGSYFNEDILICITSYCKLDSHIINLPYFDWQVVVQFVPTFSYLALTSKLQLLYLASKFSYQQLMGCNFTLKVNFVSDLLLYSIEETS